MKGEEPSTAEKPSVVDTAVREGLLPRQPPMVQCVMCKRDDAVVVGGTVICQGCGHRQEVF